MKTNFLIAILLAVSVISNTFAQKPSASISFKKTSHDYGAINEDDGTIAVNFEFTNAGKMPLIIQRVVASCDCAAAEWSREPLVPGASGVVKVVFNPRGRKGKFEKLITLYSNAETPSVVLHISGSVQEHVKTLAEIFNRPIGDFRFKNTHAALGRVFINEKKNDTIEFISAANAQVKIGARIIGLPHLTVRFIPETIKPQEKGLMIVTFDVKNRNDWGFVVDRFSLTQNDTIIEGSLIIVSANIEENFAALTEAQRAKAPQIDFPNQNYDFGEIAEGQLVEKDFVFSNIGKGDLIIRKIKPSCGCTTVEPADKIIKSGKQSSFKASIHTKGFSGMISKSITIITNDPVNPTVLVRITGTVNPPK